MSIESVMPSKHLILCRLLLLLPSVFPRVFSNESAGTKLIGIIFVLLQANPTISRNSDLGHTPRAHSRFPVFSPSPSLRLEVGLGSAVNE